MDIFIRTKGLIGEEAFDIIKDKKILIAGLGGVGGSALIALLRSGLSNFVLIDSDNIDASNLNRQLLYTVDDIGKPKVEIAKKYVISVNSCAKVEYFFENLNNLDLDNCLNKDFDFIIDAIDDVNAKIKLAQFALKNNIPFIMSLGMANRIDPSKVFITKLSKTTVDPLAKKMRYEIKNCGLDVKKIDVVFSSEQPLKDQNKLHSMIMVPSSAGLNIAYHVISNLINKE